MIPKVIHYCWFGRNPLPDFAKKCIDSWRKFFPEYEIREWNEDNFDVSMIPYTKEAYDAGKYAFVSDYARFWILYKYGGLYFDTDVEVIKPMEDIVNKGPFMGCEIPESKNEGLAVAPGLGIGSVPGLKLYSDLLELYSTLHFQMVDGGHHLKTVVEYTSELLQKQGLKNIDEIQYCAGVWIYPSEYFSPWDAILGKMNITENTRSIHWYSKTWLPKESSILIWSKRILRRIFGKNIKYRVKRFLNIH
jgi:mannosyltransferase OCH1-like enzyme